MKTAETSFFQERLHDARLSFVSGHASLSAYSMTFTVLYLQVMIVIMLVMMMIMILIIMAMIMMMIMTFTVLYLQRGMGSKDFRLVKPLIQVKYFIFMETRKHEYFSGWLRSVRLLHMSHKSVRLQTSPRGGNGDNNINSTKKFQQKSFPGCRWRGAAWRWSCLSCLELPVGTPDRSGDQRHLHHIPLGRLHLPPLQQGGPQCSLTGGGG